MTFLTRKVGVPMWALAVGSIALIALGGAGGSTNAPATTTTTAEAGGTTTRPTVTTVPAPTTTAAPEQAREVVRFAGASDKSTPAFQVVGQWEIAWAVRGGAGMAISALSSNGDQVERVTIDPGEERTVVRQSCSCYLELKTFGSTYTVVVTDLPG